MQPVTVILFINLISIVRTIEQRWCEKQIQVKNTLLKFKNSYYPDINFVCIDTTSEIQNQALDSFFILLDSQQNKENIDNKIGGIPSIFFADQKNKKIMKYEYDLNHKDLLYFSKEFFTEQINEFNSEEDIASFNRKFPNLIFFYGNPEQFSNQLNTFIEITSKYPIYYRFIVRPDKNMNFHKYFFIQNYSDCNLYLTIRRFYDQYDNVLSTKLQDEFQLRFDQFMQQYSQPTLIQELNHKSLMHLKKFQKQFITFHLIRLDHISFEQQTKSFQQSIVLQRQSKEKMKLQPLFIQSDLKGLAKVLLYRFLKKSLKETPLLVAYQFDQDSFYFNIYDYEKNKYSFYNMKIWIEEQVRFGLISNIYNENSNNGFQKSLLLQQLQTPSQYLYLAQTFNCQAQIKFKALLQLLQINHDILVINSNNINQYQQVLDNINIYFQVKTNEYITKLIQNTTGPQLFYICTKKPQYNFEITLNDDVIFLNEKLSINTEKCRV